MRVSNRFSTTWLDRLKPTTTEQQFTEPGSRGLILRVFPGGEKTFAYRYQLDGKRRLITLGTYPTLTLKEAHDAYLAQRKLVASGVDPLAAAAAQKVVELASETIETLVDEWQRLYCDIYRKHPEAARALLKANLPPEFLNMKAKLVTRRHVFRLVLDPIAERGSASVATDVASLLKQVFDHAVDRERLIGNPLSGLKKTKERKRKRTLSDEEIGTVWQKLDDTAMTARVRLGVRLLLVIGKRVGEMVSMTWKNVDLVKNIWTIPDSKNDLGYLVPLSPLAVHLLAQLKVLAGDSDFVFPSWHRKTKAFRHMTERAFSQGIRSDAAVFGIPHFTPHDFRRTMRTNMSRMKVPSVVAELCLGHKKKDIEEVYDMWEYIDEKREAMEKWSAHLEALTQPKTGANVLQFPAKATG